MLMIKMALLVGPRREVKGYKYRQVDITSFVGEHLARTVSERRELNELHAELAKLADVTMDNHQTFCVNGLWLDFHDEWLWVGTEAVVGRVGQY